jgi:hypothetical protein
MSFAFEFFGFATLWIAIAAWAFVRMHRNVEPSWVPGRLRRGRPLGRPHSCCLDVPCSAECANRHQAMYAIGALDGAQWPGRVREMLRQGHAELEATSGAQAEMPR